MAVSVRRPVVFYLLSVCSAGRSPGRPRPSEIQLDKTYQLFTRLGSSLLQNRMYTKEAPFHTSRSRASVCCSATAMPWRQPTVVPLWIAQQPDIKFVLANRHQVADPNFVRLYKIGLFIPCIGKYDLKGNLIGCIRTHYSYACRPDGSDVPMAELPVTHDSRQQFFPTVERACMQCWARGEVPCVHCNESKHRGPAAGAALALYYASPSPQSTPLLLFVFGRFSLSPRTDFLVVGSFVDTTLIVFHT